MAIILAIIPVAVMAVGQRSGMAFVLVLLLIATLVFVCRTTAGLVRPYHSPFLSALQDSGVADDQIDACMSWAVGDDWHSVVMKEIPDRLRARHAQFAGVCGSDLVLDVTYRIGRAWLAHREDTGREL